ncbi:MAG: glycerol-3-phosphate dehydrogenase [Alphaproteobacteria bacterium]|nr:glycerol-3-phosphate dehydrogenase [Alphaproteobacteria bacterium]MCB9791667.1 glycerol-3-phosphate dehydrogenase [Alphaproteobacteria bacterium]MCB9798048.1 glycerol-3-phosphate dehydrogenase [Alphaproteobacteria bacterium]
MPMRVSIVGSGPLGQALGLLVQQAGHEPLLGFRDDPVRGLSTTTDPAALAAHAELMLLAVPGWELPELLGALPLGPEHRVVICGRGPAPDGSFLTELVAARTPALRTGVLAGPTQPGEVLRSAPAAAVIASRYDALCAMTQEALHSPRCRVYTSSDPRGVELASAFARVFAAVVGMADAMKMGVSARGLVMSRGLAEASRLGAKLGGAPESFNGLAGLGDLVASASTEANLAYDAGRALVEARAIAEEEAFRVADVLVRLAAREGVDLPLTEAVHHIHSGALDPAAAFKDLMSRAAKKGGE